MLPQDRWYLKFEEPIQGTLLALRTMIMDSNDSTETMWSYSMPFFKVGGKRFCYLWVDNKSNQPYIGFVQGDQMDFPLLKKGIRTKMKVFYVDPNGDLPLETIKELLEIAVIIRLGE